MGFTALDGLPMGTRPGQIDPGVVLYLISEKGMTAARRAGLPLSGMRPEGPLRRQQRHARAASEQGSRAPRSPSITLSIASVSTPGMLAAALQGIDAFVFTAGIGENSAGIRARIAEKLAWLGVALDAGREHRARAKNIAAGQPGAGLRRADRRGTDDRAAHLGAADEQETVRPEAERGYHDNSGLSRNQGRVEGPQGPDRRDRQ